MKNIIIWGAKGQGLMAKEVAQELDLNCISFFDNNRNIKSPLKDMPIYYDIEELKRFENEYFTVLPRIKIGKNVAIGAGSVVTKDINDNQIVYGNPARLKL